MNRRDLLAGLFWLGISVFVVIQSVKSDLGSLHSPGPGFLPFWSAVILGTLSIILIVTTSLRKKWEGKLAGSVEGPGLGQGHLGPALSFPVSYPLAHHRVPYHDIRAHRILAAVSG